MPPGGTAQISRENCDGTHRAPKFTWGTKFSWSDWLLTTRKRSARGRRSIVETLFQKKSWKRRASRHHTGIKRGSQRHRDFSDRRSPMNRIAIHVLPHSSRVTGLNRCIAGKCNRESSCSQCQDQRKHDDAHERPVPPRHRTNRNVCCFRFQHDSPGIIIESTRPKANVSSGAETDLTPRSAPLLRAFPISEMRQEGGCLIS